MSAKLFDHLEKTPPKITSSGVFISDPRVEEKGNIEVLLKGQSFPLKFIGIYPNRVLQLDLQEVEGLIDATGDDDTFETACKIHLNSMADWHINNTPTIQLQIHRRNAPFTAKLSNHLMARGVKKPASIRAKLANHRASARLIIQFINTDTQESEKSSVNFDPSCFGGKNASGYQEVEVPAPEDYENFDVYFFIHYEGDLNEMSTHEPYLFLADVHLTERMSNSDLDYPIDSAIFTEADAKQRWLYANVTGGIRNLDCIFVKCGDQIAICKTEPVMKALNFFDTEYYLKENSNLNFENIDPFSHYMLIGTKEGRNPNPEFSVNEYLLRHSDVEASNIEPLVHYANIGKREERSLGTFEVKLHEVWRSEGSSIPSTEPNTILKRAQDLMIPMGIINTKKLAVFIVPEHDAMSGGIYSIFSIANVMRKTRQQHGFDVLVMTRPNANGLTYVRNSAFPNGETVLRTEQLRLFSEVSELQLHIPEYATVEFVRSLSPELTQYLLKRDHLHINILNQNIRLMPEPAKFRDLVRMADTIGQSISHHAFFNQELTDYYNLPSLLLPAYTDLTPFPASNFSEKENLILYSDDDATYRKAVLEQLMVMGDYELVKIKDITFDKYMDLATRCKFSVSFGEGFDGYVAQPIYQGGIGMALYTDEFFPDDSYLEFENFFSSEQEMVDEIVPTIRRLEKDKSRYEALNASLRAKWDELYSYDDYVSQIGKLAREEYEIFPGCNIRA